MKNGYVAIINPFSSTMVAIFRTGLQWGFRALHSDRGQGFRAVKRATTEHLSRGAEYVVDFPCPK